MADLDGDGIDDMISGSYWPGDIYIFEGTRTGFAKGHPMKDASGRDLNAGPPWADDERPELESLASAPRAHDWDDDGDLDLLVGNITGTVILITNEGSPRKPSFSTKRRSLEANGNLIEVPDGDSGPVIADWNRDGRDDLIVGAGDGSVWFYRNKSKTGEEPVYDKGIALLEAPGFDWDNLPNEGSEPTDRGTRAKVDVSDIDGDGWLDLLVGGIQWMHQPPPDLDAEQTALRDRLQAEKKKIGSDLDEAVEKHGKYDSGIPEIKAILVRTKNNYIELEPLVEGDIPHGFVWYCRRIPPV